MIGQTKVKRHKGIKLQTIDWRYFLIIFCVILAYSAYLPKHLGLDSWNVQNLYAQLDQMQSGHFEAVWAEARFSCFSSGRFFRGLIFMLFALAHKASWLVHPWVNWVAIFFMCLSGCTLWKIFRNIISEKTIAATIIYICCLLAICNPFFTDWMQFIECQLYYPLALWLAITSAGILQMDKQLSKTKRWFVASGLLILSAGLYQIVLQFFVMVSVGASLLDMRGEEGINQIKKPVRKLILALSVYCVAAVTQLVIVLLMHSGRVKAKSFVDIVEQLTRAQRMLWTMVPYTKNSISILFPVLSVLLAFYFIGRIATSSLSSREKIARFFVSCLGFVGYYVSLFLPLIVSELWFPQRSMVGFWGILFIIAIMGYCVNDNEDIINIEQVICILACVLLLSNINSCIRFGTDLYRVNAIDEMRGELIFNAISEYENTSGITIDKVAFYQDSGVTYTYPTIVSSFENNEAAWSANWNYLSILETVSGRRFEQLDYSSEKFFQFYEKEMNWNEFDVDQIRFQNNIAYVAIY